MVRIRILSALAFGGIQSQSDGIIPRLNVVVPRLPLLPIASAHNESVLLQSKCRRLEDTLPL